jgi:hypothetical protein
MKKQIVIQHIIESTEQTDGCLCRETQNEIGPCGDDGTRHFSYWDEPTNHLSHNVVPWITD